MIKKIKDAVVSATLGEEMTSSTVIIRCSDQGYPKIDIPCISVVPKYLTDEEVSKLGSKDLYTAFAQKKVDYKFFSQVKITQTFVDNDSITAFFQREWEYRFFHKKRQIVKMSKLVSYIVYDKKSKKIRKSSECSELMKLAIVKFTKNPFFGVIHGNTNFTRFLYSKIFLKHLFTGRVLTLDDYFTLFKKHSLRMPLLSNTILFEILVQTGLFVKGGFSGSDEDFLQAINGFDNSFMEEKGLTELRNFSREIMDGSLSEMREDLFTNYGNQLIESFSLGLKTSRRYPSQGSVITLSTAFVLLGKLCGKIGYKINKKTTFKEIYDHAREWAEKNGDFPCEI